MLITKKVNAKTASIEEEKNPVDQFNDMLRDAGMRVTAERTEIFKQILSFDKLFSVTDLVHELEQNSFRVSLSTIYNTLSLLVDNNVLKKVNLNSKTSFYERHELNNLVHLKCEQCGKLKVVKDNNFYAYMKARKFQAFTTTRYELVVYGICNDCARRNKRKKTN